MVVVNKKLDGKFKPEIHVISFGYCVSITYTIDQFQFLKK